MLRLIVLLLLLGNLGFYAWSHGHLGGLVGQASDQREPERLQRQVRPEAIRLPNGTPGRGAAAEPASLPVALPPASPSGGTDAAGTAPSGTGLPMAEAASAVPVVAVAAATQAAEAAPAPPAPVPADGRCMEAGPFAEADFGTTRALLRNELPADAWRAIRHEKAGVFMLYLGRFPTREAMLRRQTELRPLGIKSEEVRNSPGFEFGLSLGRYTERKEADARLDELVKKGLRAARLVTITPPVSTYVVRVPVADTALQGRLAALRPRLGGRSFAACRGAAAA